MVLTGEVSSTALRDQVERRAGEIPWVRGVINGISVSGIVLPPEDHRFLQPVIGKELLFKDDLSVIIQKVIINPNNRRVVAMVVKGRFPDALQQSQPGYRREERSPEQLMVLPVRLILHLARSSGFIQINSTDTTEFKIFEPTWYITPDKDWLPPYPYCTDEVLFVAE